MSKENTRELRNCLGEFTTGVTIVTCTSKGKAKQTMPVGITANSFSSLSLDPPLVIWSIGSQSGSRAAFESADHFAVNVLGEHQQELAMTFAKPGTDRFANVAVTTGIANLPLIDNALAQFECKVVKTSELGDHILFIGEVLAFRRAAVSQTAGVTKPPLIFSRGQFASLAPEPVSSQLPPSVAQIHTDTFYKDYLPYLLARAANDSASHFHARLKSFGLTLLSWRVLASLSDGVAWTVNDLCKVSLAKQPTISKLLDRLESQRLIKRNTDKVDARKVLVTLTKTGATKIAPVIEQAQGYGETLSGKLHKGELEKLKITLRKLIDAT